jgi:poly-gamma-glutamate synthesis protein (capsule biosynthesis protein)
MFDRNVRKRMKGGVDPFSSLRSLSIMNDYEIRMLNLEGPIVEMDRSKCQQKAYNFQFASNTAKMLKSEGFTAVTIANNHIYDCYKTGIASTQKYLNEASIDIVGNIKPENDYKIITTNDGFKIAIVGIDTTINSYPTDAFYTKIKELKKETGALLITMHSGEEYLPRATQKQQDLAHKLIDNGADVVIGHHPHVVENMEVYNGSVIFYSLGNFIFDQIGDKENEGVGVGLKISKENISMMLFPYNILNSAPTFMSMQNANDWCNKYYEDTPGLTSEGCTGKIIR